MVNAAKSRGTNDTSEAPMVMILDPNNHPDHYNSQLLRHVISKMIVKGGNDMRSTQIEKFEMPDKK